MNNTTIVKRQTLRHNEYYSMQSTYDWLYAKSERREPFKKLLEIIIRKENILLAFRNIKSNVGSKTAGVDNKTIAFLKKKSDDEIVELVRRKLSNYIPQKVRRVMIPKFNGDKRPLGIPTITDRLVQQCILQVLEPICEAKFAKHSYGFRPLRNSQHAIARAYFLAQQADLHYVVDVDIKGFFDNINHKKLLKQIWAIGIRDKKVIAILQKMLLAEIEGTGRPSKGTPQGGIISPLLANIALNEFDHWIESQWVSFPTNRKYKGDKERVKSLKDHSNLKETYIVRYADDFKLFCRNYDDAKRYFEATKKWLKERLNLEVNEGKSKIVNLRINYSEFLGIKFKVHIKGKTYSRDRWVIESHISDKAKVNILCKLRNHIKSMQQGGQYDIDRYNKYIFGIHSYYSMATHVNKDFGEISFRLLGKIKARLKKLKKAKRQDDIPNYIAKYYGKSAQIRFLRGSAIIPIGYVQHTISSFQFKGYSPYKEMDRVKIHKDLEKVRPSEIKRLMETRSIGQSVLYNDNRISRFVAQAGKCAITTERLEVERTHCHHRIPKKLNGTDDYSNLIIIHENVHRLIHATRKETIKNLISKLNLDKSKFKKLNDLRNLVGNNPLEV